MTTRTTNRRATNKQSRPPLKRATADSKRAVTDHKIDPPPIREAEPLAHMLEQRLAQVVDLVEILAQTGASRLSDERLVQLERRVMELSEQPSVSVDVAAPPGTFLTREQEQLVLTYDAFRTALGRVGAASIVLYRVVNCEERGAEGGAELEESDRNEAGTIYIQIMQGHVDEGSSIVVYAHGENGTWGKTGPYPLKKINGLYTAVIESPPHRIERLEVLDGSGRPVRLGFQLPREPDQVPTFANRRLP
jgi:hypothetical protein